MGTGVSNVFITLSCEHFRSSKRTRPVYAPSADRRELAAAKHTVVEQLAQGAPQIASALVDFAVCLPLVVVCVLTRP